MIKSIHFQNFKALRDATLPLGPFTLIVGPNASGKSTAMEALRFLWSPGSYEFEKIATAGWQKDPEAEVRVEIEWLERGRKNTVVTGMNDRSFFGPSQEGESRLSTSLTRTLANFRIFSFDAHALAAPVQTHPHAELQSDGSNLAAVLSALNGKEPERFDALNQELQRWLPEFDRVVFDFLDGGKTEFLLRTRLGRHKFPARDLSHGTLFTLAYLTLAHLPTPPAIVGFEEPDRGIHPRLLREIRDGMYRLAFPKEFGETRSAVQVIATTHSPYLLDLFKEQAEQIVIAQKDKDGAHFERLSEKPHISELLDGPPLGDIWFSGILGGVPTSP
jgi:predicted ATPase